MDDNRRKLLTTFAGLGLAVPARALAQSRILREGPGVQGPGTPHPPLPGQTSPALHRFAGALDVLGVARHGALDVLWLGGPVAGATFPIVTLEDARAGGRIVITEKPQATVPDLIVENRGKSHVLMLAGEILIGGKQDRVLKQDALLPPLSGPRRIGVFCVEQGRWSAGGTSHFQAQGMLAAPSLRHQLMDKADQRQVWSEVDRAARRAATTPPPAAGTGVTSYQRVYAAPEVRREVKAVESAIDVSKIDGALGAAVFLGPRLAGIDAFRDPALFSREWPKLLRAYAVEAIRAPHASGETGALRARTLDTLRAAAHALGTAQPGVGVGHLFEFPIANARGTALIAESEVIHLAVLW